MSTYYLQFQNIIGCGIIIPKMLIKNEWKPSNGLDYYLIKRQSRVIDYIFVYIKETLYESKIIDLNIFKDRWQADIHFMNNYNVYINNKYKQKLKNAYENITNTIINEKIIGFHMLSSSYNYFYKHKNIFNKRITKSMLNKEYSNNGKQYIKELFPIYFINYPLEYYNNDILYKYE
jgi:hypothetical protein